MSCGYSVPLGPELRRRLYRCRKCKSYAETIELPYKAFIGGRWSKEEIAEVYENEKRTHTRILQAIRAKKNKAMAS